MKYSEKANLLKQKAQWLPESGEGHGRDWKWTGGIFGVVECLKLDCTGGSVTPQITKSYRVVHSSG